MFKHKKLASIFILAAMLLTLLPTAGFAEELESSAPSSEVTDISTAPTIADTDDRLAVDTDAPTPPSDFVTGSAPADTDSTENDQDNNDSHSDSSQADSNIVVDSGDNSNTSNSANPPLLEEENNDNREADIKKTDQQTLTIKASNMFKSPAQELTINHILTTEGSKDSTLIVKEATTTADLPAEGIVDELYAKNHAVTATDWVYNTFSYDAHSAALDIYYKPADLIILNQEESQIFYFKMQSDGNNAYCYNENKKNPKQLDNTTQAYYKQPVPFAGQENVDKAALIRAIIHVGYPYDALGLSARYNMSPFAAIYNTQTAIYIALGQISEENLNGGLNPYLSDLLKTAQAVATGSITISPGQLILADNDSLHFVEQEDGIFTTEPVIFQGYTGTFSLDLPENIAVYDATDLETALSPESLSTDKQYVFKSTTLPVALAEISSSYTYHYPNNIYYYEAFNPEFQNLVGFEDATKSITASFPITVTELDKPVIPILPIDPIDPGNGGGGDYTPDTPSTPSEPTPPAETIIEEDTTPLAEAPEMTPSVEVPAEEVTLAEDPVPLAPAAPTSDNPKTGHPVHVIFILQVCLLLAAGALLLNDVRQYKTK